MCARRNGDAAAGSIGHSNFRTSSTWRSGAAEILNVGGRTKFSGTVAPSVPAFLKYIPGQTIGRSKISDAKAPSSAKIGAIILSDLRTTSPTKISTSLSILIASAQKKRRQIGRTVGSRSVILGGHWESCMNPAQSSVAIFAGRIRRRHTHGANSVSPRSSIIRKFNYPTKKRPARSILRLCKNSGRYWHGRYSFAGLLSAALFRSEEHTSELQSRLPLV